MIELLQGIPKQAATFILAALPILELRGSIPIAVGVWKLHPLEALLWSVAGNLVPMILILYYVGPLQEWLSRRYGWARRFFSWLFERTRRRFDKKYERYGAIALCIFVALPLPATGAWTGALAAWLFDIRKARAMVAIGAGTLIAGIIVTAVTVGVRFGFSSLQ